MRVFVLLVLVFLTFGSTALSDWISETVDGGGVNPSLAINSAGYPCIAYPYEGIGLKYAEWDGSQWLIECAYSQAYPNLSFVSLALDTADTPHICFGLSSLFYVTRDDSLEWQTEDIPCVGSARHTSMALDNEGFPHVAYGVNNGTYLGFASRSDSTWVYEVLDGGYNTGWYASLKLDTDNNPHISYARRSPDLLMYASMDVTSGWSFQVIDSLSDECMSASLALSGEGVPHISYNAGSELRYAYWTGSGWHIETVDACDSGSWQYGTSIALDSDDLPHIAYCSADGLDLMYASWNGSDWQHEVVYTFTPAYYSGDPDLALDASDRPHIAFFSGFTAGFDLMYAWNDGTGISEGFEEADCNLLCGYPHPNPTLGMTTLQFILTTDSHVIVTIYDVSGHTVQIPESGQFPAGTHDISFSVTTPGIYMMRIVSEDQSLVRRFIVLD